MPVSLDKLAEIMQHAKEIAKQYRDLTGRPLGITGEIAEYEAARLLKLKLACVRQSGYDATREIDGKEEKLQIKGRCIISNKPGQRIGTIQQDKEWDFILLVLLNVDLEPFAIYEASRPAIIKVLNEPGSKSRNERGALTVCKFKSIGKQVWPKTT